MWNEGDQTRRWISLSIRFFVIVAILSVAVHYGAVFLTGDMPTERAKTVNDARGSIIQVLAGVGLLAGLVYTARTYRLTKLTQRAERFTKSVTQLGDTSESVRAGGVYSLQLLLAEDPTYWPIVADLLSAHVREKATRPASDTKSDVAAAVALLVRRPDGIGSRPLDLQGVGLKKVNMSNANFALARFDNAQLTEPDFTDARLRGARFPGATLTGATLSKADLSDADLSGADCRGADFFEANVDGADVGGAQLSGAQNLTAEQRSSMAGVPASEP